MLLYDITREVFSAPLYDGDPKPELKYIKTIGEGSMYNLSRVSLCNHTGTHIDAPLHYDEEGVDVGSLRPGHFCGKCTVVTIKGVLTGEDMERLLPHCHKRLIIHGSGMAFLSLSAARVIADSKLLLIGTDALSIATPYDELMPHLELARAGIPVLEGLYLEGVEDGDYTISALPLKMKGAEASPCRALLMREPKGY